ncbi:MAG: hypothetical protein LUD14_12600, partial [Clostridiales bacterium]|nr:hypothetical protein [Clostridiales bacterium]
MFGRKGWFLAIAVSLGLSMGFTGQYALAAESDAEVIEINDEAEDICLYADENGYFYQTADETHFYYVDAATGEQVAAQPVEIPEGDYAGIYYFEDDGYAVTDTLLTVDESMYYFGSDAKAVTYTLLTVDESTYYFGSDGKAVTDAFQTVDDSTYYFGTDGVMYTGTGLKTIGDSKYYFVDGVVQTGWQDI